MASTGTLKSTAVWTDRFVQPSPEALLGGIPKTISPPLEAAREKLVQFEGLAESVMWQGVWHWTLVYRHESDLSRAMAYLVPDPIKPRLCVPVPNELVPGLPVKKLSRFVRDGILHAPVVGQIRWACWSLSLKSQAEELMQLVQFRLVPPAPTGKA